MAKKDKSLENTFVSAEAVKAEIKREKLKQLYKKLLKRLKKRGKGKWSLRVLRKF